MRDCRSISREYVMVDKSIGGQQLWLWGGNVIACWRATCSSEHHRFLSSIILCFSWIWIWPEVSVFVIQQIEKLIYLFCCLGDSAPHPPTRGRSCTLEKETSVPLRRRGISHSLNRQGISKQVLSTRKPVTWQSPRPMPRSLLSWVPRLAIRF